MRASITALAALAAFAVFMVAFTLVPAIVIVLAGLVLFGSAFSRSNRTPAPAGAAAGAGDGDVATSTAAPDDADRPRPPAEHAPPRRHGLLGLRTRGTAKHED